MSDTRPNIIFVLTDDQGYGDLGCTGNPVIQTPNIDALYEESVHLTDYHVGPTCAPTRAGLMTGHYHNSTGVWHTIGGRSLLRKDEWSLATALSEAGYATGLFGKWHLGDNYPYRPQDRGFQTVATHGGGGVAQTPDYWGNKYIDDTYNVNGTWTKFEGYCTDIWYDQALKFIEEQKDKDQPFFCYVSSNAPHGPFIVDDKYSDPYVDKVEHQSRANFYGMITNIDENLGVLRSKLVEWGLAENTIFIFMTDNGTACGVTLDKDEFVVGGYGAGLRGMKNSEYDGGHRVPLFMHWPAGGLTEKRDVDSLTANVDMMPTLLALCGIDPGKHEFDGKDIAPLLWDKTEDWPDRIMVTDSQRLAYPVKWRKSATMTSQWRLVNGNELFDARTDREQRLDVAAQHPDVVARLREGYEAWWEKVGVQFDAIIPISLGTNKGESVLLNSHDWRNDPVLCAWNQAEIRAGLICNGYWEVDVEVAGTYRFELRRWPREQDSALTEGIPGELKRFAAEIKSGWGGGRAIPITQARLQIMDVDLHQTLAGDEDAVIFEAELPEGTAELLTTFTTTDGDELGAYFVYVERISG